MGNSTGQLDAFKPNPLTPDRSSNVVLKTENAVERPCRRGLYLTVENGKRLRALNCRIGNKLDHFTFSSAS